MMTRHHCECKARFPRHKTRLEERLRPRTVGSTGVWGCFGLWKKQWRSYNVPGTGKGGKVLGRRESLCGVFFNGWGNVHEKQCYSRHTLCVRGAGIYRYHAHTFHLSHVCSGWFGSCHCETGVQNSLNLVWSSLFVQS